MKKNYREKLRKIDLTLLIVTILLLTFGFVSVLSASYPEGIKKFNDGYYYAKRHAFFLCLGIAGMVITANMKREYVKKLSPWMFLVTLGLVALLWTPLAKSNYGQARWIKLPGIGMKIQPSDFIKVTSVLYIAKILEDNYKKLHKKEVFIVLFLLIGISAGPILIRDFSTGFVIAAEIGAMYLVAGVYFYQFLIMGAIASGGLGLLVFSVSYRKERVMSFFKGTAEKNADETYQITQALYAIAMGGKTGVGLFHSRQKYTNLPFAYNDFIFAIICEEFGALGGILLITLFFIFVCRGYRIAYKATNYFDKFTAVGLTTFIGIQAVFNIGVSVKFFPVTGITLPFISYGGTALIVSMAAVGLLLRISRDA